MSWPRRPAWTAGTMHPPPPRRAWCGPLSLPDFWTRLRRGCSPKMNLRQPCHTGGAPAGPTRWPHFERPWRGRGRASTRATPWARCYAVGRAGALWCCHAPTRRASARPDTLELIAQRREHSVNAKCVVKTAKHVWSTSKAWARRAPDLHLWGFVTTPPRGSYETTPAQVTKPPRQRPDAVPGGGFRCVRRRWWSCWRRAGPALWLARGRSATSGSGGRPRARRPTSYWGGVFGCSDAR